MATISERFGIRGENFIQSSYGAESAMTVGLAVERIREGSSDVALIGGYDHLDNPFQIANLMFDNSLEGDIFCSTSSSFAVVEKRKTCEQRGKKPRLKIEEVLTKFAPYSTESGVMGEERLLWDMLEQIEGKIDKVILQISPFRDVNERESRMVQERFPEAVLIDHFEQWGSLMAAAEPLGMVLAGFSLEAGERGLSITRSIFGKTSAIIVRKDEER